MKIGPDAHGTAENEFGSAKHENGAWRVRYCRKRVWGAQNMKTGLVAVDTVENGSGSAKHENWTPRTRFRPK
jgi:hypothetical protein